MFISRHFSDLDFKLVFFIIPPLFLLFFLSFSSAPLGPFPSTFPPLTFFFLNHTANSSSSSLSLSPAHSPQPSSPWKHDLGRSRIALCLVGGARRFELTGPSIIQNIIRIYPNSDLFLHSPLDNNAFKLSLLKVVPRIASVRIFKPQHMNESDVQLRVLTASNSPNGIQGLLQYFNLVQGCLTMIEDHQTKNNFTYDWIIRTRVDGYWNAPLDPQNFVPGHYLVPPGSTYGGLNDRLGIGDFNTSRVALSRLSLISELDSSGYHQLNSETAFKAQLITQGVPFLTKRLPFCIVTDRKYAFPPTRFGVPVAAMSSRGPLSGAKCRPCKSACEGSCVATVMPTLYKGWSWTNWENGTLKLCDAHGDWEEGWEKIFDKTAGKKNASSRKRVRGLSFQQCINDFNEMKKQAFMWDSPPIEEICMLANLTKT